MVQRSPASGTRPEIAPRSRHQSKGSANWPSLFASRVKLVRYCPVNSELGDVSSAVDGRPSVMNSTNDPEPRPRERAVTPPRVLVVDDESTIRIALRRFFTRLGWEVEEAGDGGRALEMILE